MKTAFELSRALPEAELKIIPAAAHAADEPGIREAIVRAVEKFAGED
jgi:proline iminopeptidase